MRETYGSAIHGDEQSLLDQAVAATRSILGEQAYDVAQTEGRSLSFGHTIELALALAAYTWRRGFLRDTPWRARIAPIVAALGLLAFTGTAGENTDLGAHLFGFLAGIGLGVALARVAPIAWLQNPKVQRLCGVLTALVLVAAWAAGLRSVG
jgi:membrane associated rhomboid family serine protease